MESESWMVLHFSSGISQHRLKGDTFSVFAVPGDDWAWACPRLGRDRTRFVCCLPLTDAIESCHAPLCKQGNPLPRGTRGCYGTELP